MRLPRLLVTALYIGYLVQVGLLMVVLPWSSLWPLLMTRLPPTAAWLLDAPAARGALAGFGLLHLLLVVVEVVHAGVRDAQQRGPRPSAAPVSKGPDGASPR